MDLLATAHLKSSSLLGALLGAILGAPRPGTASKYHSASTGTSPIDFQFHQGEFLCGLRSCISGGFLTAMFFHKTSPELRVSLETTLLELIDACPVDHCNPAACPLFSLRQRPYPERKAWVQAWSFDELRSLASYHQNCVKLKAACWEIMNGEGDEKLSTKPTNRTPANTARPRAGCAHKRQRGRSVPILKS
jgi:hypothetical protein